MAVENDSVIYEHIIPRSVRQKWMRKASIEHLDLVTSHVGRERHKLKQPDNVVQNSFKQKENDYGYSIVSHDVLDYDHGAGGLITPEEEKAVFNAFGVKLRHIGIHLPAKKRPANFNESISNDDSSISVQQNEVKLSKEPSVKDQNVVAKTGVKLREGARKVRPLSMPVISDEIEKNYQLLAGSSVMGKETHKAYISPHAKVPWKRNLVAKNDEIISPKSEGEMFTVNEDERNEEIKSKRHLNESDKQNMKEKRIDGKPASNEEKNNILQSVSERLKSFEKYDQSEKNYKKGTVGDNISLSGHQSQVSEKHGQKSIKKEKIVNVDDGSNKQIHIRNGMNLNANNPDMQILKSGNEVSSHDLVNVESKMNEKTNKDKIMNANKQNNLLNIFQTSPIDKPEIAPDKKNDDDEKVGEKGNNIIDGSDAEIDKNIVLSLRKSFEKKVKKMVILTGEQRERELRSHKGKTKMEKSTEKSGERLFVESDLKVDKAKEIKNMTEVIPITNLDDAMPVVNKNQEIPVTNLDDVPSPKHSSNQNKVDKTGISERNFKIVPNKKPGKYDADRRELVAPKVFFEKPVIGLVSALSPKGKKNGKVNKLLQILFEKP